MKHLSRRDFIHSGCAAGAISLLPSTRAEAGFLHRGSAAAATGHKAQVNFTFLDPESYGQDYPFIDLMRTSTCWIPFGTTANTDVFSAMNAAGIPTSMIGGTNTWRCSIAAYIPSTGTNWCFDYDGTATISVSGGGGAGQPGMNVQTVGGSPPSGALANATLYNFTGVNASDVTFTATFAPDGGGNTIMTVTGATNGTVWPSQRLSSATGVPAGLIITAAQGSTTQGNNGTYYVQNFANNLTPFTQATPVTMTLYAYKPGDRVNLFVAITAITTTPTKIRMYRVDQAATLNGGQITSPDFINFYKQYGCFRFMDWQYTNGSVLSAWADRPVSSALSWLGITLTAYCGIATKASGSSNDYTTPNNISGAPTSWVDGMLVQTCLGANPNYTAITGVSINGTTGVVTVTAAAHGLSSGAHVFFPNDSSLASTGAGAALSFALQYTGVNAAFIPAAYDFTITNVTTNTFDLVGVNALVSIASGTYNSSTGAVTLTFAGNTAQSFTQTQGQTLKITALTGTGAVSSLVGSFAMNSAGGNTMTCTGPTGLGSITITGGTVQGYQNYSSGGNVAPAIRIATATLPAKRVLNTDCSSLYFESFSQFTSGSGVTGVGQAYSFVYNASLDALLFQSSPSTDNGKRNGVPIEVITQLCNECSVPPWICLPALCTTDFAFQTATYLKANLNSSLRVRIEYGNELWNGSFASNSFTFVMGGLQGGLTGSSGFINNQASPEWVGYRFYTLMGQIDTVYSGAMGQVYRMLALNGNTTSSLYVGWVMNAADIPALSGSHPYSRADAFAMAPYFEGDRSNFPTGSAVYNFKIGSTSAAFSEADTWFNTTPTDGIFFSINNWSSVMIPFWSGIATTYGLEWHQYEGGWGIYPFADQSPTSYNPGGGPVTLTQQDVLAFWLGYKASSNWGTQYAAALAAYKSAGGKFASNYFLTTSYWNFNSMFGAWGPNIYGVPTPYYMSSQPTPEKVAFDAYNAS